MPDILELLCRVWIFWFIFFAKEWKKEDRTILSKGHAAAVLYPVLTKSGRLPEEILETFCKDNTSLATHPYGFTIFFHFCKKQ